MKAYDEIQKLTGGRDPTLPISCSTFCKMFDLKMTEKDRARILDWVIGYLQEFPNGLDSRIGEPIEANENDHANYEIPY